MKKICCEKKHEKFHPYKKHFVKSRHSYSDGVTAGLQWAILSIQEEWKNRYRQRKVNGNSNKLVGRHYCECEEAIRRNIAGVKKGESL